MRYKCIKGFLIPECDNDGWIKENDIVVEKGTVWKLNDSGK